MFEYFDMSKYDIDIEGYRCGYLTILIEDWNGPFAELGEQVNNSNIRMSLKGWIDDPEVGPMGDIDEGHADSIYSFKTARINVVLNEERKWPFQIPSEVAENLPSVRGVGEIYAEEEHALHESLDGIAIFYLSVPQDYWDVLLQGLQITHARKRFQSWEIHYLIPETSLKPDEKDSWFGWGSKWGRVRPRHFDTKKTMVLGVFSFGFSNTILPIEQVDKIQKIKSLSTSGKETERVRIKITTLAKQFSSYSGQVEYRKLKGNIDRNSQKPFSTPKYVGEAEVELKLHDENDALWLAESEEEDADKREDGFRHGYYTYFTDCEDKGEAIEHGRLSLTIYVNQFQLDKYFEKIKGNLVFLEVTLDLVDWEDSSSGIVYNYSLTEISDTDSFERFPVQAVGQSISESIPKALSREELLEIKQSVEQLSKDVTHRQDEIESTLRNLLQTTRAADELRYDLKKKFRILLALIVLTVLIQIFSN
jgi:hypothetical protein